MSRKHWQGAHRCLEGNQEGAVFQNVEVGAPSRTPHDIKTFQCLENKIIMMGIEGPESFDFSDNKAIELV